MTSSQRLRIALGIVMILLGAFLLARIYIFGQAPKAGSQAMDTIFGVFFLLRGAINLRRRR